MQRVASTHSMLPSSTGRDTYTKSAQRASPRSSELLSRAQLGVAVPVTQHGYPELQGILTPHSKKSCCSEILGRVERRQSWYRQSSLSLGLCRWICLTRHAGPLLYCLIGRMRRFRFHLDWKTPHHRSVLQRGQHSRASRRPMSGPGSRHGLRKARRPFARFRDSSLV